MSTEQQPEPARSFGGVADAYDRGRPSYPREAAVWLTSDQPLTVLELGAGTGKLTEQLVALGHDVHATEPDPQMLAVLEKKHPGWELPRVFIQVKMLAGCRTLDPCRVKTTDLGDEVLTIPATVIKTTDAWCLSPPELATTLKHQAGPVCRRPI